MLSTGTNCYCYFRRITGIRVRCGIIRSFVIVAATAGTTSLLFLVAPSTLTFPVIPPGLVTVAMRELGNVGFSKLLRALSADKRFRVMILFVINSSTIALLVRCVVVGSTIRFKFIFTRRDFFGWIIFLGVIVSLGDGTICVVSLMLFCRRGDDTVGFSVDLGERIRSSIDGFCVTGRDGLDSTTLLVRVERRAGDEGLLMASFSFAEPLEFTLAAPDRLVRVAGEVVETGLTTTIVPSLLPPLLVLALAGVFLASSVCLETVSPT